jgi:hypothetical protein
MLGGCLLLGAPAAHANPISGVLKIVAGVFQVPLGILAGTLGGPPIVGTIAGAFSGTLQGVGLVTSGVLELAWDGVSLAKAAAPFLLPFLL